MVTFLQRTFTSLVHAHAGRTQVCQFDALTLQGANYTGVMHLDGVAQHATLCP